MTRSPGQVEAVEQRVHGVGVHTLAGQVVGAAVDARHLHQVRAGQQRPLQVLVVPEQAERPGQVPRLVERGDAGGGEGRDAECGKPVELESPPQGRLFA